MFTWAIDTWTPCEAGTQRSDTQCMDVVLEVMVKFGRIVDVRSSTMMLQVLRSTFNRDVE
jgi:hypothetical protein